MNYKINNILTYAVLLSTLLMLNTAQADVKVPFKYAQGKVLFKNNCASCHGEKLNGTKKGPPLLHDFYKPSHHGDGSFYRAALKGVQAHHWNFGNMPPVKGMTEAKMKPLLGFIRFYQKEMKLFNE